MKSPVVTLNTIEKVHNENCNPVLYFTLSFHVGMLCTFFTFYNN